MDDLDDARRDYLALRDQVTSALIATVAENNLPEASHAPCVRRGADYFLYLSELASHTRNLRANPAISLLLIEPETRGANAFARRRISLQGEVCVVGREDPLFGEVMAEFHRCFGKVMQLIEPLADFRLFRISPIRGRYVRGFAQAYDLCGENLDELAHVDPRR